jgi:hypothetical protein
MDNEASTTTSIAPQHRRALPRRTLLLAVAGLVIAGAILVPLALSMSRSLAPMLAPNAQYLTDGDGSPMATPAARNPDTGIAGESAGTATDSGGQPASAQPWDRMIIRTGTLQLTVKDVADSIQRVRAAATAQGGYVFSSESRNEGDYTYATITLYIPAANFDQVLPQLRALGGQVTRVANENITSSDVTEEYTDLDSQLRNLKATEGRMLALQAKAERMEDILAIDRELRSVQAEIERIQGRMNYLGKRAEMSTFTVYLSPALAPAPTVEPKSAWQPLEAAEDAWNASLAMLATMGTRIIAVVVFFWWLIPVLALAAWAFGRVRRRMASPAAASSLPAPDAAN